MEIRVELFLRFRLPGTTPGPRSVTLPAAATVADLLTFLDLPAGAEKVVLVDGHVCSPETVLAHGQSVTVFPPLEGG